MKPPTRAVCLREFQSSLKQSSKLLIEDKIAAMGVGNQFRVLDDRIEAPGGGIIIFNGMQSHTAESIKSLEGYNIAWFDEAHRASHHSLGLLRPTIRMPDSELWFSWNPKSAKDPIDVLLRSANRPDAIVVEANYRDNPWFPKVLRDEMEYDKRRDPDRYAHVWLGKYQTRSSARVFTNWKEEEFETPDNVRFYFGADWGFSVDPTVLVRCWINGRTLFVDYEAWQVGCEIDHSPMLFNKVPGARRWPITADSADPQNISYLAKHGFPRIKPSIKGQNSVEQGIEFLKAHDIVVHPRCIHVVDELSTYSYAIDKQTEEVLPKLEDKKNHTIDALRYACEDTMRAPMRISASLLAKAAMPMRPRARF